LTKSVLIMKRTALLIFLLICFAASSYAQYTFDIKGKTLAYARGFEKAANGTPIELTITFLSGPHIGQPEVYRRKQQSLPDLLVYYFPNGTDSTLNQVLYEWDDTNFANNRDAIKQPLTALQPYIDHYLSIQKQAEAIFGKPETTGSLDDKALIETGRFQRKDKFNKDGVSIEMYIVLSNKQETNGIVSIMPTHRVRMYVKTGLQ
jgi:hypothetical protein